MINQRTIRFFDWIAFSIMLILLACGLLFVFSATYTQAHPYSLFFKKQLFGALTGLLIYALMCAAPARVLARLGYLAFFGTIILLLYTQFGGWMVMGGKRWISLYLIRFQPSELVKLFLPPFIAYYLYEEQEIHPRSTVQITVQSAALPIALLFVVFVLILKQPDLGTALIVLGTGIGTLWLSGLSRSFFIIGFFGVILGAPLFWQVLKPYQKQRVMVLLGYGDDNNERYQIEQSKIAIGSGGLWGKGFLAGTQNKLAYLPEDHSDFIFSVLCEEWGFVGALAILFLFCLLLLRILLRIMLIQSMLYQLIAAGLILHIMLSAIVNIAMVTGLLPTVGIPLPLFSYGVTNLWVTLASFGWINNCTMRRFEYT